MSERNVDDPLNPYLMTRTQLLVALGRAAHVVHAGSNLLTLQRAAELVAPNSAAVTPIREELERRLRCKLKSTDHVDVPDKVERERLESARLPNDLCQVCGNRADECFCQKTSAPIEPATEQKRARRPALLERLSAMSENELVLAALCTGMATIEGAVWPRFCAHKGMPEGWSAAIAAGKPVLRVDQRERLRADLVMWL